MSLEGLFYRMYVGSLTHEKPEKSIREFCRMDDPLAIQAMIDEAWTFMVDVNNALIVKKSAYHNTDSGEDLPLIAIKFHRVSSQLYNSKNRSHELTVATLDYGPNETESVAKLAYFVKQELIVRLAKKLISQGHSAHGITDKTHQNVSYDYSDRVWFVTETELFSGYSDSVMAEDWWNEDLLKDCKAVLSTHDGLSVVRVDGGFYMMDPLKKIEPVKLVYRGHR